MQTYKNCNKKIVKNNKKYFEIKIIYAKITLLY